MLQLVTGRAGSGKSEYCLQQIEQLAKAGVYSILVVPEQSSFVLERALALRLGGRNAAFTEVKSFRSLCGDIFTECGGGARKRANDAVRISLVRRAVASIPDKIVCFQRHKRDLSFFALAASVIEELKNAGVLPGQLEEIANCAASPLTNKKLQEIAHIYAQYEQLLHTKYLDSASELSAAALLCKQSMQFAGKTLFFDGFSGFTAPQFDMLGTLMHNAQDVVVTLCCDDLFAQKQDVFSTVRKNGMQLLAAAKKCGVDTNETIVLGRQHRFAQEGLENLELFLAGCRKEGANTGVYKIAEHDRYDEMRTVADEIVTLVREYRYSYSDIVVITRDLDAYRTAIVRTFDRFGIPYFCDSNRNMLYTPVMLFVLAALDIASGIRTEYVLNLLKTSLCDIDDDSVGELENYLYVWNIDRAAWYKQFVENPNGFDAPTNDEAQAALARMETARQKIVSWLYPVAEAARQKDCGKIVKAVYETLKRSGALRKLEQADGETAREAAIGLEMLDQLYNMIDGDDISIAELRETARLLASTTAVGDIPPTLEQVLVGAADRMRTDHPKAVFVVGLNDGVFPRTSFDTPLLTGAERDLLAQHGAELTRNYENSAVMEELYLYRALTCAAERVYLCYAKHTQRGAAMVPSSRIETFLELYGAHKPSSADDPARYVVNADTAMQLYADAMEREDGETAAALRASECAGVSDTVLAAATAPSYQITDRALPRQLLGDETTLSASRIETFSQCRFRYFLQYILKIKPLKKAEISPIAAGNFVHAIMENALRTLGGGLVSAPKEKLAAVVEATAADYTRQALGETAAQQPRTAYLIERLKAQSLRLLQQLQSEQANSAFRPCDYELEIGDGVQPIVLRTPDGTSVRVVGKVDRVDIYQKDGKSYIRVVDYKTGTKQFRLRDVYYGLQVQMLLYLFTIAQNAKDRYGDVVPAAVMYMPSDPGLPAEKDDAGAEAKKAYRMDGIVLDDPEIIEAMEHGVNGVYIPVEYDKRGHLKADKLASLERLGVIREHIEDAVIAMAQSLFQGDIEARPTVDGNQCACDWCDYAAVCRHDRSAKKRVLEKQKESELFVVAKGGGADV